MFSLPPGACTAPTPVQHLLCSPPPREPPPSARRYAGRAPAGPSPPAPREPPPSTRRCAGSSSGRPLPAGAARAAALRACHRRQPGMAHPVVTSIDAPNPREHPSFLELLPHCCGLRFAVMICPRDYLRIVDSMLFLNSCSGTICLYLWRCSHGC